MDTTHIEANTIKKVPERVMKHLAKKIFKEMDVEPHDIPDYTEIEDHKEAKIVMKEALENIIEEAGENAPEYYEHNQWSKTEEFKEGYKKRAKIEPKNAEIKRFHGLDRARGYGLKSVSTQTKLTIIAVNLKRICKLISASPTNHKLLCWYILKCTLQFGKYRESPPENRHFLSGLEPSPCLLDFLIIYGIIIPGAAAYCPATARLSVGSKYGKCTFLAGTAGFILVSAVVAHAGAEVVACRCRSSDYADTVGFPCTVGMLVPGNEGNPIPCSLI